MSDAFQLAMQIKNYQIADLKGKLEKVRADRDAESVRADMAERRERSIAAERDLWKHQAEEAHAALKSAGLSAR